MKTSSFQFVQMHYMSKSLASVSAAGFYPTCSSNTFTRHVMADEKFFCQLRDKNAKQQRHNIQVNVTSFQV